LHIVLCEIGPQRSVRRRGLGDRGVGQYGLPIPGRRVADAEPADATDAGSRAVHEPAPIWLDVVVMHVSLEPGEVRRLRFYCNESILASGSLRSERTRSEPSTPARAERHHAKRIVRRENGFEER